MQNTARTGTPNCGIGAESIAPPLDRRTIMEAIQRISAIKGEGSFQDAINEAACCVREMLWRAT